MSAPAPPPRVLPAMAMLPDGRFALRIGLRHGATVQAWDVREFVPTIVEGAQPVTGWRFSEYMSDDQIAAAGATTVEPLAELGSLGAELEAAGQFAAARMVRERAVRVRHAWVGA